MLKIVFVVCAIVCFVVKAIGIPTGQFDMMNAGFAFLAGSLLV